MKKSSGDVEINNYKLGKDDDEIRNNIGVVFQNSHLDNLLTVYENIEVRADFYNISSNLFKERIEYISQALELTDILNKKYGILSGGQKRRVDIARALINEPKILFLDEPTTGLDPQTRIKVWEILESIRKTKNITIFLTTHYLEEVINADMVAIIDEGKIIAHDTPMKLKEKYAKNIMKVLPKNAKELISYLKLNKYDYEIIADTFIIKVNKNMDALKILKDIEKNVSSFEVFEGDMDQVFINLTGKDIRREK